MRRFALTTCVLEEIALGMFDHGGFAALTDCWRVRRGIPSIFE